MIYLLEIAAYYEDTWKLTFYFVTALSLLLGLLWTYYQVIIKGEKKKQPLKENIIYNNSDDLIEKYDIEPKKKVKEQPINNYVIKDDEFNNYIEKDDDYKEISEDIKNENISIDNSVVDDKINKYEEENNYYKETFEDIKIEEDNIKVLEEIKSKNNSTKNNNRKKNNIHNKNNSYKKNNSNYKNNRKNRTSN